MNKTYHENDLHLEPMLAGGCRARKTRKNGISYFFERFNVSPTLVLSAEYQPVFLAVTDRHACEEACSFGLFRKHGVYWEVHGSESSVWNFDRLWMPEETSLKALRHRVVNGSLGMQDGVDCFATALLAKIDYLEHQPTMLKVPVTVMQTAKARFRHH